MDQKTLDTLEFYEIQKQLKNYISSEEASKLVDQLLPATSKEEIVKNQEETAEALKIIFKYGRPPIYGIHDFTGKIAHIGKGGIMDPQSLLDLSSLLRATKEMKSFISEEMEEELVHLKPYFSALTVFTDLERRISKAIISPEEISDDASVTLSRIRQKMHHKARSIRETLDRMVKSGGEKLQDSLVTMRDGRYVIPVKSEYRASYDGVVHDRSSSGQTVYIEPMAVVQLNNDLRVLQVEEEEEIYRILLRFAKEIYEERYRILKNQEVMTHLDFVFAKGRYALSMDGIFPDFNEQGYIKLKEARHPLIDPKEVVPINLYLGKDYNTLVITGPNTGGKTVSLKTVGLLTVMACCGLHIPAEEPSSIAIFDSIYTDIGDEQSIEQSLSTFSSHMTNIVSILDRVEENSLVLFDELGAGTDPVEGAALAMSILEYLLKRNIRTMATTHYSQLKMFALETEGVKNGAVEFDVKTLSPTYKLSIGIPGKSNAFEISRKIGLKDSFIRQAEKWISKENKSFEDILESIDQDRKEIEELKQEQIRLEKELREKTLLAEHERQRNENMRLDIRRKAEEEALEILEKAKAESEDLIKELRYLSADSENRGAKVTEIEARFNQQLSDLKQREESLLETNEKKEKISIGDTVEILGLGEKGEVLSEPNHRQEVQVQVGILKINAKVKNLRKTISSEEEDAQNKISSIIKNKASQDIAQEIDLRGKNIEESRMELDKYLDDSLLIGLKEVSIIHGKGTGALREGITEYLKKDPRVKSFRYGKHGEGGLGVSIVELK